MTAGWIAESRSFHGTGNKKSPAEKDRIISTTLLM
jgi:hypothetical protein